jgi:hypothetical protein
LPKKENVKAVRHISLPLMAVLLFAVLLFIGCRQEVVPPEGVAQRLPPSIEVDGAVWTRVESDPSEDPRLRRVFRERAELAEGPDFGGTLVAYASPNEERVRFFWIQAWSESDGWTWIEMDGDGSFLASGQGVGTRFPGP